MNDVNFAKSPKEEPLPKFNLEELNPGDVVFVTTEDGQDFVISNNGEQKYGEVEGPLFRISEKGVRNVVGLLDPKSKMDFKTGDKLSIKLLKRIQTGTGFELARDENSELVNTIVESQTPITEITKVEKKEDEEQPVTLAQEGIDKDRLNRALGE